MYLKENYVYDSENKIEGEIILKENKFYVCFFYKNEKVELFVAEYSNDIVDFIKDACLWDMRRYVTQKFLEEWE